MAWSDAVRAAAAEARRLHFRAKRIFGGKGEFVLKGNRTLAKKITRPAARLRLAEAIRKVRQTGVAKSSSDFNHAVISTGYRNLLRSYKGRK